MLFRSKSNRLFEVAVVVTRYFGGIKLGAGGLVRAYSGAVAENISAAQKVLYETCAESSYTAEYPAVDSVLRYFAETGANVLNTDYQNEVTFTVAVKKCEEEQFNSNLINRLNGKIKIRKIREYFFPFKL